MVLSEPTALNPAPPPAPPSLPAQPQEATADAHSKISTESPVSPSPTPMEVSLPVPIHSPTLPTQIFPEPDGPLPPTTDLSTGLTSSEEEDDPDEATVAAANSKKKARRIRIPEPPTEDLDHSADLRYDIRLRVNASTTPDTALKEVCKEWMTKMFEADPTFRILPWYENDEGSLPDLAGNQDLPQSLGEVKKYFNRARPVEAGGNLYMSVFIRHSMPVAEINSNIDWWLKQHKHGWWLRSIQAEQVATIGWLLYSTRQMDTDILKALLEERMPFSVGLRWRSISKTKIPAIHIEVAKHNLHAAHTMFSRIYSSEPSDPVYPGGIRLRFVIDVNFATNSDVKAKISRMCARQSGINSGLLQMSSWEITSLSITLTPL